MANRTYVPDLASRLAMADSDARGAVDAQTNSEDAAGEPQDSDDDSLETPGRPSSRFILHDDYAEPTAQPSHLQTNVRDGFRVSDDDGMDLDDPFVDNTFISVQVAASEASEATTTILSNIARPIMRDAFGIEWPPNDHSPPALDSPHVPSVESNEPSPNSDRENTAPVESALAHDDPFNAPASSWHTDMNLQDPNNPVRPYSQFPTPANDPTLSHLREISGLASWTVSSYKVCLSNFEPIMLRDSPLAGTVDVFGTSTPGFK